MPRRLLIVVGILGTGFGLVALQVHATHRDFSQCQKHMGEAEAAYHRSHGHWATLEELQASNSWLKNNVASASGTWGTNGICSVAVDMDGRLAPYVTLWSDNLDPFTRSFVAS